MLSEHLDHKATRRLNIKRPGVKPLGRLHVEAVVSQALIDLIHPFFALLPKTDMEGGGIFGLPGFYQGEEQSIVVEQHGEFTIPSLAM
jgi:hypothetical protein